MAIVKIVLKIPAVYIKKFEEGMNALEIESFEEFFSLMTASYLRVTQLLNKVKEEDIKEWWVEEIQKLKDEIHQDIKHPNILNFDGKK